jgi:exodeoxyribonuclease VII small subunit
MAKSERNAKPRETPAEPDDVKYGAAVDEIERILASIDRDEVDLDELGQKVERAVELLKVCRAKLKATEARVTDVLKDLAAEEAAAEGDDADADDDEESDALDEDDAEKDEKDKDESAADVLGSSDAPASGTRKPRRRKDEDDEELPF